ncbi:MAG TPA: hypothetical protein VKQ70_14740 [Caulobacteraceae bacterium]|nr:hypothetical protein [Caulobacteraceae bacterium]
MSQATAMFRSHLREAVRDASGGAPPKPVAARAHRTVVRLWVPLTPLWIILSPFAILAAPLLLIVPQTRGIRPFRAIFAVGRALFALSGTVVDVDTPDALVRIRIY